jgi:hypothetical protein
MCSSAKTSRRGPTRSFRACLREFLTPALWKQAQTARHAPRRSPRWATQPLILVLLLMTWCCGDSQAERFETAKAFCVVCLPKRRRPGQTVHGFQKALARLPMVVLRCLAAGVRHQLAVRLQSRWSDHGFIAFGCDGSRLECPRTEELERRLGHVGKKQSAPNVWVTALVHLRLGVPWAWRWGKSNASERSHLERMASLLPRGALLVADAGYFGFTLAAHLVGAQVSFLIRMSSHVTLYTREQVRLARFREGLVYYWPKEAQQKGSKPLLLRLIRLRAKKKKHDVWLLTNVLDAERLPLAVASQFYRWRWENEGLFRTYKRTLAKMKLLSRSVRLVHREAEGSFLAAQVLIAQGVLALPTPTPGTAEKVCSPRKVLLAFRQEMQGLFKHGHTPFYQRLQQASRDRRPRTSAKVKRKWARRKTYKAPKPPKILTLSAAQKTLISRLESDAA